MSTLKEQIAKSFMAMAEGLESGQFGEKPKVALTGMGSEHGESNSMQAAIMAAKSGVDVYYIGTYENPLVKTIKVKDDEEGHKVMERMVDNKEVDAAVTMHYPFPIGVSTVGRVTTPAHGKDMFIANTTGTSSTDRVEGMILNAISGIIVAKATGITNPTVGILNIEGAKAVEKALNELKAGGYDLTWGESSRADGGVCLRGNDVLKGTTDILVTDSLTGNMLMKVLSAFMTGGSYESTGFGYGPGIGIGYDKLVFIVSRASGAPVLAHAMTLAGELVRNNILEIAKDEFKKAKKAGLDSILEAIKAKNKASAAPAEDIKMPPKEPVPAAILGVEVMDLEDAVKTLWKEGIYAESGMGCTGPVVMMSDANEAKAREILKKAGYIS
ncbi:MAG: glycine reductase [Lachnospiraceae bacterium]|nr:glycine reductase [Lachnospiraceae bacterium]